MAEEGVSMQVAPFAEGEDSPTPSPTGHGRGGAFTNRGYQPLATEERPEDLRRPLHPEPSYRPAAPPTASGYTPVPPIASGYTPAPPSFSTQQATNTVVMTQPGASPQATTVEVRTYAKEHMIFTVLMLVICCALCNPTTMFCLCPALFFAGLAIDQNNRGRYNNAKSFGEAAFVCNAIVIVYNFVVMALVAIAVAVVVSLVHIKFNID